MKTLSRTFYILIFVIINLSSCKKNNDDVLYDRSYLNEIKAARQEIALYMGRNSVPGATFAVSKGGEIIYSEGLGLASKDLEVPATRHTKFRIGQLSENLTSLIYYKLVEDGIFHPDSTVQHYFPDFPKKKYKIPIRHLVQHTSGIRAPSSVEQNWRGLNISIQKGLEQFMHDSLVAPPGMYQIASLYNYNLLGAIMEKTTEMQFHELLKKYVTDTLGLENTMVDNPFITIKGRTDYFDHNFVAQVMHATWRDMRYRAPSEGLLSNAEDLVKFGNALLYSEYISEEIRSKLFKPIVLNDGLHAQMTNGWAIITDYSDRKIYGKSGSVTGGSAALIIYPREELIVACATNLSSLSEDFPVFLIASKFLPDDQSQQNNKDLE